MNYDVPKDKSSGVVEDQEINEKVKACPNCGKEGKASDNFCRHCGNKFENEKKDAENENEERSQMKEKGKKFHEKIKKGDAINISELAVSESMTFSIEPGTKFYFETGGKRIDIDSKKIVAAKLAEGKYLNSINGEVTVCDFEHQKKILEEQFQSDPQMIEDYMKSIIAKETAGKRLDEVSEYVKEFYKNKELKNEKLTSESKEKTADKLKVSTKDLEDFLKAREIKDLEREKIMNTFKKEVEKETDADTIDLKLAKVMREMLEEENKSKIENVRNKLEKL
jgi:hypothetical protein